MPVQQQRQKSNDGQHRPVAPNAKGVDAGNVAGNVVAYIVISSDSESDGDSGDDDDDGKAAAYLKHRANFKMEAGLPPSPVARSGE